MVIETKTVIPEMCECGRLYKDRVSHLGKMMCSACYTGLSVDELKKLWSAPIAGLDIEKNTPPSCFKETIINRN